MPGHGADFYRVLYCVYRTGLVSHHIFYYGRTWNTGLQSDLYFAFQNNTRLLLGLLVQCEYTIVITATKNTKYGEVGKYSTLIFMFFLKKTQRIQVVIVIDA